MNSLGGRMDADRMSQRALAVILATALQLTCRSSPYDSGTPESNATNVVNYSVVAPPPPKMGMSQLAPPPPAATGSEKPLLQMGPVQFHPQIVYRLMYATGLQAQPGQQYDSLINELSPGIVLNIGSHWVVAYTPTLRFYSDSHFRDVTDQLASLAWGTVYNDWKFSFYQNYAFTEQPLIETGAQTKQSTYNTAFSADYQINTDWSLQLSAAQNFLYTDQVSGGQPLTDSITWSTLDWLNYQFSPRFGAAIGIGGGYTDLSAGYDMPFEQVQGRISVKVAEKLSFVVSGGVEVMQFVNSDISDLVSPLFSASLQYEPLEYTSFSLIATRTVGAAYFAEEVVETATVSANVRQRLFKKFFLDVGGGYYNSSYIAQSPGLGTVREDHGTFFNARLSTAVLRRGTVGIFYQYYHNSSDDSGYDYSSSQTGLELAVRF